jgi:hypothetical protein
VSEQPHAASLSAEAPSSTAESGDQAPRPDSAVSGQPRAASLSAEAPSSTAESGDQAPQPDSALEPGSTSKSRVDLTRKFGRFLHAYLKSMVLLVTAVIAGVAALVCFPKDAPVAPSGGLRLVTIDTPFAPSTASVTLTDDHSRNGVTVVAQVISTTQQSARATLSITVPRTTWGGANKCPPPARCTVFGGAKNVSFGFPRSTKYLVGVYTYYRESVQVFIPDVGYNTAWNSEYISATLPNVQVYLLRAGNYIREDVPITIAVRIPDASKYTWTSGSPPVVNGSDVAWEFTSPPGAAQVNNGVSLPAQDLATKLIFLAGALLGIAGGALVGAIQEAVKSE